MDTSRPMISEDIDMIDSELSYHSFQFHDIIIYDFAYDLAMIKPMISEVTDIIDTY